MAETLIEIGIGAGGADGFGEGGGGCVGGAFKFGARLAVDVTPVLFEFIGGGVARFEVREVGVGNCEGGGGQKGEKGDEAHVGKLGTCRVGYLMCDVSNAGSIVESVASARATDTPKNIGI